ncbi:hypothetical protein N665_0113s0027 [Sinapis alba]|nr:hypothetical protein N665_0113s0027 [Sinapis alba]
MDPVSQAVTAAPAVSLHRPMAATSSRCNTLHKWTLHFLSSGVITLLHFVDIQHGRLPFFHQQIHHTSTESRSNTYRVTKTCFELCLLDDDKKYIKGLKECSLWASSGYVCNIFAVMLLSESLSMLKLVRESTKDILLEDVLYIERKNDKIQNQLLQNELNYNKEELSFRHKKWLEQLTTEQKSVYDEIIAAVNQRKDGDILLNVASNRIASLLLLGGRTAHSRFGISINPDKFSTCKIQPGSDKADIVMGTLNSLYLRKYCKVLQLRENMRLLLETNIHQAEEIQNGENLIDIPKDLLIMKCNDPIEAIVSEVFRNTFKDSKDPTFFQERAILYHTNADVEIINDYMLDHLTVMILRNIDPNDGLCNETKLQITQLANHITEAKSITVTRVGEMVFLHRMLITPSDPKLPFKMRRRQFSLNVAFAMTINKSHGKILENVEFYLPKSVFSHGQFYLNKDGKPQSAAMNVVFKDVFKNLFDKDH